MKRNLTMFFILIACGDRTVADDDPKTMPLQPDVADEPSSDSSTTCRDGLAACDGACVDLGADDENCGVCGHACMEPEVFGHCEAGACPPALRCARRSTSIDSCNDVCALHGQRCVAEPTDGERGCGGEIFMYTNVTAVDGAIMDCESHAEAYHAPDDCTERIDWTVFVDFDPFSEAVACCCTQEPA